MAANGRILPDSKVPCECHGPARVRRYVGTRTYNSEFHSTMTEVKFFVRTAITKMGPSACETGLEASP